MLCAAGLSFFALLVSFSLVPCFFRLIASILMLDACSTADFPLLQSSILTGHFSILLSKCRVLCCQCFILSLQFCNPGFVAVHLGI